MGRASRDKGLLDGSDRTPSQRARHSRRKGASGELQAREPLALLTGCEWERSANQSRVRGGQGNPDLRCEARPCLHPEVKVGAKAPNWRTAMQQAIEDAGPGCVPFCLLKQDRGKWVLVVEVERFAELCTALRGGT